jgi:hypothetical protein
MEYYALASPKRINAFPYFGLKEGDEIELYVEAPDFYFKERVVGMLYTFPFAVFALVPAVRMVIKRFKGNYGSDESQDMMQWICVMLSGMTLIAVLHLLTFFFATMRYFADVTPVLSALALVGFWLGYRSVSSNRFLSFTYSGVGIILAGITIIVSNLLALQASERFDTYSPHVLPALDALFKAVFSG